MPTTVKPAPHGANEIKSTGEDAAASPKELLPRTDDLKNDNIIQSSFQKSVFRQ
jgi:hypothetical protein